MENTQLYSEKPPKDDTMDGMAVATMVPSTAARNMASISASVMTGRFRWRTSAVSMTATPSTDDEPGRPGTRPPAGRPRLGEPASPSARWRRSYRPNAGARIGPAPFARPRGPGAPPCGLWHAMHTFARTMERSCPKTCLWKNVESAGGSHAAFSSHRREDGGRRAGARAGNAAASPNCWNKAWSGREHRADRAGRFRLD